MGRLVSIIGTWEFVQSLELLLFLVSRQCFAQMQWCTLDPNPGRHTACVQAQGLGMAYLELKPCIFASMA